MLPFKKPWVDHLGGRSCYNITFRLYFPDGVISVVEVAINDDEVLDIGRRRRLITNLKSETGARQAMISDVTWVPERSKT